MNKGILGAKRKTPDLAADRTAEADTVNRAGGKAYKYDDRTAAVVFAMTSTFPDVGGVHQMDGKAQLEKFREYLDKVDPEFVAKLALYARHKGKMKDAPLVANLLLLKREDGGDFGDRIFPYVVDNPTQYRNAASVVMSGTLGSKSFGHRLARVFNTRLFGFGLSFLAARGLTGNDPSLADVIRMTHPNPNKANKDEADVWGNFFKFVLGREGVNEDLLPKSIQEYIAFKKDPANATIPKGIEITQLMGMLPKDEPEAWCKLARIMSWTQVFKNIATLSRHGALADLETVEYVVGVLKNREKIIKSRQFPYAVFNAYRHLAGYVCRDWRMSEKNRDPSAPPEVLEALQDVLDIAAVENAPKLDATVAIGIDTSGSMFNPVTGYRKGATTTAQLVDVAALFGATAFKQNPASLILPFDNVAKRLPLNPRDSVATIADQIAKSGGGGTNVSDVFVKTLEEVRRNKSFRPDAIIILSDMQTWIEGRGIQCYGNMYGSGRGTAANELFEVLKAETGKPVKLVCWNLSAGESTQAVGDTVLNIGGWSEALWKTVVDFLCGPKAEVTEKGVKVSKEANVETWLSEIDSIDLSPEALKDAFGRK